MRWPRRRRRVVVPEQRTRDGRWMPQAFVVADDQEVVLVSGDDLTVHHTRRDGVEETYRLTFEQIELEAMP